MKADHTPLIAIYDAHLKTFREGIQSLRKRISRKRVERFQLAMEEFRTVKMAVESLTGKSVVSTRQASIFEKVFGICGRLVEAHTNRQLISRYVEKHNIGIELYDRYQKINIDMLQQKLKKSIKSLKWKTFRLTFDHHNLVRIKFKLKETRKHLVKLKRGCRTNIKQYASNREQHGLANIYTELKTLRALATIAQAIKKKTRTHQFLVWVRTIESALQRWQDLFNLYHSIKEFRADTAQSTIINFSMAHLLNEMQVDLALRSEKIWDHLQQMDLT